MDFRKLSISTIHSLTRSTDLSLKTTASFDHVIQQQVRPPWTAAASIPTGNHSTKIRIQIIIVATERLRRTTSVLGPLTNFFLLKKNFFLSNFNRFCRFRLTFYYIIWYHLELYGIISKSKADFIQNSFGNIFWSPVFQYLPLE